MSGFTRDAKRYGDRLVYEALGSKCDRYHAVHCGCREDWVTRHAVPAGFTVLREGAGWVGLVGPGLTEGVDEWQLTANALWEAVTGLPGTQDWFEPVRVFDRSPQAEAAFKDVWAAQRAQRNARAAAAEAESPTSAQLRYLEHLVTTVSREHFTVKFDKAVKPSPDRAARIEGKGRRGDGAAE